MCLIVLRWFLSFMRAIVESEFTILGFMALRSVIVAVVDLKEKTRTNV